MSYFDREQFDALGEASAAGAAEAAAEDRDADADCEDCDGCGDCGKDVEPFEDFREDFTGTGGYRSTSTLWKTKHDCAFTASDLDGWD